MAKYWRDPETPLDGSINVLFVPEVHGPHSSYTECVELSVDLADPDVTFDELMNELVRVADEVDYEYSDVSIIGKAKDKQSKRND